MSSAESVIQRFEDPHTNTKQYLNKGNLHTDADYLRRLHGMAKFDPDVFDHKDLAPGFFQHRWDAGRFHPSGGVEWFATGKPNSGKSTLALRASEIEMDQNEARVVWRAATGSRSEWLPYAPVARVCIPKGYEPKAIVVPKDRSRSSSRTEVPLEDVVREVVYYSDIMDLNLRVLQDGMFHVVYPDPKMRGCQWVYEESDKLIDGVQFKADHDPVDHWWFGWTMSLVERGPFPWTAWMCDEVASLAREGVSKDKYNTLQKVELLGTNIEDFRKNGISAYFFGHKDKHLHNLIRDRIRWRVAMNGTANPRHTRSATIPGGMETVPMNSDITSGLPIGQGLLFNEQHFELISWPKISKPLKGDLKVYLSESKDRGASVKQGASA